MHEITKNINYLNYYTVAGFDGVSVKTLKAIAANIIEPLAYIYEYIFPDKLKLAILKPLFKISMISNFAKILGKIIKFKLVVFGKK